MIKFGIVLVIAIVLFFNVYSQKSIKGLVKNAQNQGLSGVYVCEKNATNGVYTDANGNYSITVKSNAAFLVFNLFGYEIIEEPINGRSVVNVSLSPTNKQKEIVEEKLLDIEEEPAYIVVAESQVQSAKKYSRHYSCMSPSVVGGSGVAYDMANQQYNTEGYTAIHENGYKNVKNAPLSTFSIDVDRASYTNVRRFLNNGSLPPKDAVRIEEMINYFPYEYEQPTDEHPFAINYQLAHCPWNENSYLLQVGIQGKNIASHNLPPSNLVFLIDVSGSMQDYNKLPLLKSAFTLLVQELRPQDRVAIVVYAGSSGLVLPSTSGSKKTEILAALERLQAGGSTAGAEGLQLAYKTAEENFIKHGNNRIILATDGDFNIGQSSNAEMERLIEQEREKGIFMSVLGFGMGNYKDDKMEIIADKGNGNYAYIDNQMEAKKVFVNEFGGTLFTIAKDVKIQIEFNPTVVAEYRLVGYENRLLNNEDFEDDKKDAGELGSGHSVTALYEIIPVGNSANTKQIQLKYQQYSNNVPATSNTDELAVIKFRYKKPDGVNSILLEKTIENKPKTIENTHEYVRFSAAVASFGMILRDSEFKGSATFDSVLKMAEASKGIDKEGYRSEFIQLVKTAKLMKQ